MELLEVRALKEFPSGLSQKLIRTQRELGWGWRGEMKHQAGEITLGGEAGILLNATTPEPGCQSEWS